MLYIKILAISDQNDNIIYKVKNRKAPTALVEALDFVSQKDSNNLTFKEWLKRLDKNLEEDFNFN